MFYRDVLAVRVHSTGQHSIVIFQVEIRIDSAPIQTYNLDQDEDYVGVTRSLYQAMNELRMENHCGLMPEDLKSTSIFAVDILAHLPKRVANPGNVDIYCEFSKPLEHSISMLMFSEYSTHFTIDKHLKVTDNLQL